MPCCFVRTADRVPSASNCPAADAGRQADGADALGEEGTQSAKAAVA